MEKMYLSIAGFVIECIFFPPEVEDLRKWYIQYLTKEYNAFILGETAKVDFSIEMVWNTQEEIITREKERKYYIKFFQRKNKHVFQTYYDVSLRHFEVVLREALYTMLLPKKGFILHASSSLIDGTAYLFLGKSGAGKSTAAQLLSKKFLQLADDSVIIRHEKGEFYVHQTPFLEKNGNFIKSSKKWTLGKMFVLEKSKEFRREKIDQVYFLHYLSSQVFTHEEGEKKVAATLVEFIRENPVIERLYFRKDEEKLRQLLSGR